MNRDDAMKGTILSVTVGSHIHGLNVATSDMDHDAIVVEPIEEMIGLGRPWEDLIYESDEEDVHFVSLRKWCGLALGGNPNFLLPLFAPERNINFIDDTGRELMAMREKFISKNVAKAHLGYMKNQRKRMLGNLGNGGHGQQRKDLVKEYGFDTKYGMHLLRLGYQGVELLESGKLQLPLADAVREHLLAVRAGHVTMNDVLGEAVSLEVKLKNLMDASSMPEKPDYAGVGAWMVDVYRKKWGLS